jgi:DNA (cytosine-5)-methyltransferase 1
MKAGASDKRSVVDLFAGCGGMSLGFERAGFEPILAIDHWADAIETYRHNNPRTLALQADLMKTSPKEVQSLVHQPTVVIGGPPCQGFSISGKRDPNDPRNILYQSFVSILLSLRPKYFVMENVPNMASMGHGQILAAALQEFEDLGYRTSHKVLLASDYGVPQNRKRLFVIGTLDKTAVEFPAPLIKDRKFHLTTSDAISDLPEGSLADGSPYPNEAITDYQALLRSNSDGVWNHEITNHSETTVKTIALVPDGGNYKNLPEHLQNTRRVNIAWTRYSSTKPSLTIDTGHRHHFHYRFNRVPTVRESARIQSFPDSFIFKCSKTSQYKQVGNAVPPLLAHAIATSILDHDK